ncbi:MAG: hypothetical protein ACR2M7_04265 [Bdellovibrionales bacterium]
MGNGRGGGVASRIRAGSSVRGRRKTTKARIRSGGETPISPKKSATGWKDALEAQKARKKKKMNGEGFSGAYGGKK